MSQKKVDLPRFERVAQFRAESFNADDSTIEIVWTTGASVRRYDYWDGTEYDECLSLEPGAVRLERLNLGAPFLDSHNSFGCKNVLGSVVSDTARIADGKGTCRVLLSKAAGDVDIITKIKDGVIRNVSVGYWIHKTIKTEGDDGTVARWDVVDWEPLEISAVPIPADPGSQIRAEPTRQDGSGPTLRSCVLITKPRAPAAGPTSKARKENPMATRTRNAAPKKNAAERLAELEAENKRLADLLAAKRDGDEDKKDDKSTEDEDDKRDGDDADEENDADEDKKEDGDDDADGGRDADDDEDDKKDDERAATDGKKRASMTSAEVRKAAEAAVRADRLRGAAIREIATQFGFPNLGERHANGETSVRAFKDLVLERLADRQKKRGNTTFAATGTVEVDESAVRSVGKPTQGRDFDKGAAEMRALLGKKA